MNQNPYKALRKLVIVCGGTGGHFYPGLSVARAFAEAGGEVRLFVGGKNSVPQAAVAAKFGIQSDIFPPASPPAGLPGRAMFMIHLCRDIFSSYKRLGSYKPQAILAMGSYNSIPPALAAVFMKIPLFLHDGNARLGKANIFLSKRARRLLLSFPPVNAEKCACPWTVTGMPVRPELASKRIPKQEAIAQINVGHGTAFSAETPTVLVFGGSLGAETINRNLPRTLAGLSSRHRLQAFHLAGAGNLDKVKAGYAEVPFPSLVLEKTEDMHLFYSAADIVVCRAGGSTVAELSIFAKFAVLVPYPHASENHQADNAAHYVSSGAGTSLPNADCVPEKLAPILETMLRDREELQARGAKGLALAKPQAAEEILRAIDEDISQVPR